MDALKPTRRWFCPTPGWLVLGLLVAEGLLWLSERYQWFAFNQHKGWTVLIAVAVVGMAMLVMLLWYLASLIFRLRIQFSIRSPLVLVVVVAIPCSWFASEIRRAKRQRRAVETILLAEGDVSYDFAPHTVLLGVKPELLDAAILDQIADSSSYEPDWVFEKLGVDYCCRVTAVSIGMIYPMGSLYFPIPPRPAYGRGSDELLALIAESLPDLHHLDASGPRVTDAGMASIGSLIRLRGLCLKNSGVTDTGLEELGKMRHLEGLDLTGTNVTADGVKKLEKALLNCEITY